MKSIFVWACLLTALFQPGVSDIYLHCPPGSNNRLSGEGAAVTNANRLFDSQVGGTALFILKMLRISWSDFLSLTLRAEVTHTLTGNLCTVSLVCLSLWCHVIAVPKQDVVDTFSPFAPRNTSKIPYIRLQKNLSNAVPTSWLQNYTDSIYCFSEKFISLACL